MLIIAEIGQNHNGDIDLAKRMIRIAKERGADTAKFQLYDVDKIFGPDFKWYKEAKAAQLSKEGIFELAKECANTGIEFLASVFDLERFGWTEELGMKRYKIASRSIYEERLVKAIAKTGKDIIVALGMYNENGFPEIATTGKVDYLYCVSRYPAMPKDLNLINIDFNKYAGFSDHTIGLTALLIAMARGAKIIEKHFTLDKTMHGPDHSGSMDPDELSAIAGYARRIEEILYHYTFQP